MFLSGNLNPNSSAVGGWGQETGNCSVPLFMLNNKKLNGLKSASQRDFFFFRHSSESEHWRWTQKLGASLSSRGAWMPRLVPLGDSATCHRARHIPSAILNEVTFASSLPHSPSLGSTPWEWCDQVAESLDRTMARGLSVQSAREFSTQPKSAARLPW